MTVSVEVVVVDWLLLFEPELYVFDVLPPALALVNPTLRDDDVDEECDPEFVCLPFELELVVVTTFDAGL